MATHASAEKRRRQSLRRRDRNRSARQALRAAVRQVQSALSAGKTEDAQKLAREAERTIARAAGKGLLHKRGASRKISRLSKAVAKSSSTAK
jgi:small subunit ribosomal protein S20